METFPGADGIFHQAAIPSVPRSVKNPIASNEANITGTLNVLVAAKDCGVPAVVAASSSSVYGDTPVLPKHEGMLPNPLSPTRSRSLRASVTGRSFLTSMVSERFSCATSTSTAPGRTPNPSMPR